MTDETWPNPNLLDHAKALRDLHSGLLEIADQLDALARPIVVTHGGATDQEKSYAGLVPLMRRGCQHDPATKQCSYERHKAADAIEWLLEHLELVRAERDAYKQEVEEEHAVLNRLTDLLTGVAKGLKGEPPELTLHGWSDLPELAQKWRTALEKIASGELASQDIRMREVAQEALKVGDK